MNGAVMVLVLVVFALIGNTTNTTSTDCPENYYGKDSGLRDLLDRGWCRHWFTRIITVILSLMLSATVVLFRFHGHCRTIVTLTIFYITINNSRTSITTWR